MRLDKRWWQEQRTLLSSQPLRLMEREGKEHIQEKTGVGKEGERTRVSAFRRRAVELIGISAN